MGNNNISMADNLQQPVGVNPFETFKGVSGISHVLYRQTNVLEHDNVFSPEQTAPVSSSEFIALHISFAPKK